MSQFSPKNIKLSHYDLTVSPVSFVGRQQCSSASPCRVLGQRFSQYDQLCVKLVGSPAHLSKVDGSVLSRCIENDGRQILGQLLARFH